jgi:hypothetical protein
MRWPDVIGVLFEDEAFAGLLASRGRPAECPRRLAIVRILQFSEGLTDRQAADAVRQRLDWKYLFGLELEDPGFDASVLSEFRSRLADCGNADGLQSRPQRSRTWATLVTGLAGGSPPTVQRPRASRSLLGSRTRESSSGYVADMR